MGWTRVEIREINLTSYRMETKQSRGRPRQRWKDRMDKDLEEVGIENGFELDKERDQWR